MENMISKGGIGALSVSHTGDQPCHLISTFIHHTLTPEREKEMADFVEKAIIAAVTTWATK